MERILSIWEERNVYSGALIAELRSSLVKEESPPETPVEQKSMFIWALIVTACSCISMFYSYVTPFLII